MKKTNAVIPIRNYKRTKIVATCGPSSWQPDQINSMIEKGANAIRLNFSHGTHKEHAKHVDYVRKAAKALGKPVAIIQDLQGPKIRLGEFDGVFTVQKGQSLRLRYNADYEREDVLPTQYDLSKKVKRGQRIYFFDGKVKGVITSVSKGIVHVRADNDGILLSRKGINLPDTNFEGDTITKKDQTDIVFGAEHNVDYVALSFVHSAKDVVSLKRKLKNLGSNAKIISKIETRAALEDLENIIIESDAVMVARGDLATETSAEEVPIIQRRIIRIALKHSKPSIVATQMLATMTESPDPTRAEAGDVASAVLMGADAVMLSDETASGKYPIEAIEVMKRIIVHTEKHTDEFPTYDVPNDIVTTQDAICKGAILLAKSINAIAVVAETKSGATAYKISAYRSGLPIIAVTSGYKVANQLAIVRGIKIFVRKDEHRQASHLSQWLQNRKILKKGDLIVTTSGNHPGVVGTTDTIKVRAIE